MKQKNIDQARRRKNAIWGAVTSTLFQVLAALLLLWLRSGLEPGFLSKLLLVFAVLDLGSIIPVWISLKQRLVEIKGGEEDAAAQY